MQKCLAIAETIQPLASLNAGQRFDAARLSDDMFSGAFLWIIVVIVALLAIGGVAWAVVSRRRKNAARWKGFDEGASGLGLCPEERDLLAALVQRVGTDRAAEIFDSQSLFEQGLELMSQPPRRGAMVDRATGVCPECGYAASLRKKLGFDESRGDDGKPDVVTVKANPLEIRRDETVVARYERGDVLWEFDAHSVTGADGELVIKPFGTVQWKDRRSFPRVPVEKQAYVACFPFEKTDQVGEVRQFVDAKLVEMGGPGLLLEAPLVCQSGQRVLLVLVLDDGRTVESVGVVRRGSAETDGAVQFAVELLGLSKSEVRELVAVAEAPAQSLDGQAPPSAPEVTLAGQQG